MIDYLRVLVVNARAIAGPGDGEEIAERDIEVVGQRRHHLIRWVRPSAVSKLGEIRCRDSAAACEKALSHSDVRQAPIGAGEELVQAELKTFSSVTRPTIAPPPQFSRSYPVLAEAVQA